MKIKNTCAISLNYAVVYPFFFKRSCPEIRILALICALQIGATRKTGGSNRGYKPRN